MFVHTRTNLHVTSKLKLQSDCKSLTQFDRSWSNEGMSHYREFTRVPQLILVSHPPSCKDSKFITQWHKVWKVAPCFSQIVGGSGFYCPVYDPSLIYCLRLDTGASRSRKLKFLATTVHSYHILSGMESHSSAVSPDTARRIHHHHLVAWW